MLDALTAAAIFSIVVPINALHFIMRCICYALASLASAISNRNPEFRPGVPSPITVASMIAIASSGASSRHRFAAAMPV
jgi:hypothetical protein